MLDQNIKFRPKVPSRKWLAIVENSWALIFIGFLLALFASALCSDQVREFGFASRWTIVSILLVINGLLMVVLGVCAPEYAAIKIRHWYEDVPAGSITKLYRQHIGNYRYVYVANVTGCNRAGETIAVSCIYDFDDWELLHTGQVVDTTGLKRL